LLLRASSGDSEPAPSMDLAEARALLGVREGAGFDEVLAAKKKKLAEGDETQDERELNAAYDTLLMNSLRNRQEGRGVSKGVRYADVKVSPPFPLLLRHARTHTHAYGVLTFRSLLRVFLPPLFFTRAQPVSQVANELLQKLPGNVQVSVGSRGSSRGRAPDADLSFTERVGQAATAQNVTFSLISLWVLLQVRFFYSLSLSFSLLFALRG